MAKKTANDLYAIKKCVNGTLTEIGGQATEIPIKFCNTFSMETSSEKQTARADGVDVINIVTSITRNFTLGSECMTDNCMALLVGGTIDSETNKITIPKDAPQTCYSYEGTFVITYTDGTSAVKKMTIPKVQPQIDSTLGLSSVDLSTFELKFDVLSGDDEFIYTIEDNPEE